MKVSAALLIAVAAVGCGPGPGPPPPDTGARAAARTFFDGIVRQNWPAAFESLHPDTRTRVGAEGFAELARQYRAAIGFEPAAVEVRSCDERGEVATARVIVTGAAGAAAKRYRDEVTLRKGPQGWGVELPDGFGQGRW